MSDNIVVRRLAKIVHERGIPDRVTANTKTLMKYFKKSEGSIPLGVMPGMVLPGGEKVLSTLKSDTVELIVNDAMPDEELCFDWPSDVELSNDPDKSCSRGNFKVVE